MHMMAVYRFVVFIIRKGNYFLKKATSQVIFLGPTRETPAVHSVRLFFLIVRFEERSVLKVREHRREEDKEKMACDMCSRLVYAVMQMIGCNFYFGVVYSRIASRLQAIDSL